MLETLTFTGVDAGTLLSGLAAIAKRYPPVEFGILIGSNTDERIDRGIFPSLETVARFQQAAGEHGFATALHLCGRYTRELMSSEGALSSTLELCEGFGRVQVNLHGDYWGDKAIVVNGERIIRFAEAVTRGSVRSVILQHRGQWEEIPVRHDRIEYLFDVSEGGGVYSLNVWPPPPASLPDGTRLGYAGGLGPGNMDRAKAFADRYPATRLWMDMEGRVRTGGRFDLAKIREVCARTFPVHS